MYYKLSRQNVICECILYNSFIVYCFGSEFIQVQKSQIKFKLCELWKK